MRFGRTVSSVLRIISKVFMSRKMVRNSFIRGPPQCHNHRFNSFICPFLFPFCALSDLVSKNKTSAQIRESSEFDGHSSHQMVFI